MTKERWQQIEELYHAARERGHGVLEGTDPSLRQEVERLLSEDSGGKLLDGAAADLLTETTTAPILAGTQLGPYRIEAPIGTGGMGQVFRATDTRLGRTVAIKISKSQFSERFEREAKAISALNHPNICTIYDIGEDGGRAFIVMEYIEGRPLKGPVRLAEGIRAGIQIAEALEHAHAHGVVHRDLKPGNILATKSGVKVLDFGLAKLTAEADVTLTVAGGVMGTPSYMAPEQRVGKPADTRTDMYALGLILHKLLCGRIPDGQPDLAACGALAPVIAICLAKDPDDRWQSARDVRHALEMVEQASPATPREIARGFWKWTAIALGTAAALLIAFILWSRAPQPERENFQFEINPPAGAQFAGGSEISPDGKQVALMVEEGGVVSIWVRPLNSLGARKLPGTEAAQGLCWSPDSTSLVFAGANSLKRLDLASGPSYAIGEVRTLGVNRLRTSWAPNGTILFNNFLAGPLQRISASGGTPAPATALGTIGAYAQTAPQFLPDGRHFLYLERTSSRQTQGIYISSLDRPSDAVQLLRVPAPARFAPSGRSGYLMWVRGGALVAQRVAENLRQLEGEVKTLVQPVGEDYSVSQNGILVYRNTPAPESRALWFDRSGKPRGEAFPTSSGTADLPFRASGAIRLSPDGRRVVFNRLDESGLQDLWLLELGRGAARRLTFGAPQGGGGWGAWSPDGSELVLNVAGSGTRRLARLSSSGGAPPRQFAHNQIPSIGQYPHDWSPDGRYVAFVNVDASPDIWILPLAPPGEKAWPLLATPFAEDHPQFSPDGHWLAYTSDESGRVEVYIQRFPKLGDKVTVSSGGGSQPRWRRDGKELFFVTLDGRLMAAAVEASGGGLEVGEPKALFRMPLRLPPNQYTYDVTADGQRFLAMAPTEPARPEPLKVMVNWKAALK